MESRFGRPRNICDRTWCRPRKVPQLYFAGRGRYRSSSILWSRIFILRPCMFWSPRLIWHIKILVKQRSQVNLNRRGNKRLKSFGSKVEPPTTVHRAQWDHGGLPPVWKLCRVRKEPIFHELKCAIFFYKVENPMRDFTFLLSFFFLLNWEVCAILPFLLTFFFLNQEEYWVTYLKFPLIYRIYRTYRRISGTASDESKIVADDDGGIHDE